MPYYASKFDGVGTEDDPFHARAASAADSAGSAWGILDLRPDAAQQNGWALVWVQNELVSPPAGVQLIAQFPSSTLTGAVRTVIQNNLGVALASGTTFRQAVKQILVTEARSDGTRWKPLVAEAAGSYRLILGNHIDTW